MKKFLHKITSDIHKRIKVYCAKNEISIAKFYDMAIKDLLNKLGL